MRALHASNAEKSRCACQSYAQGRRVQHRRARRAAPEPGEAPGRLGRNARFFTRIKLKLSRIPRYRLGAVCHFNRFYDSMDMTRFIVDWGRRRSKWWTAR